MVYSELCASALLTLTSMFRDLDVVG
jgi:hypothetical protein